MAKDRTGKKRNDMPPASITGDNPSEAASAVAMNIPEARGVIPRVRSSTPDPSNVAPPDLPNFDLSTRVNRQTNARPDPPALNTRSRDNSRARARDHPPLPPSSISPQRTQESGVSRRNENIDSRVETNELQRLREANERRTRALETRMQELTQQINSLQLFETETRNFNTEQLARIENLNEDVEQLNFNFEHLNNRHDHLNLHVNELRENIVTQSQQLDSLVTI